MKCPVCATKTKKERQEYCLKCAWEFEYYFGQLSKENKNRYNEKLKIHKGIYTNREHVIDTPLNTIVEEEKNIFQELSNIKTSPQPLLSTKDKKLKNEKEYKKSFKILFKSLIVLIKTIGIFILYSGIVIGLLLIVKKMSLDNHIAELLAFIIFIVSIIFLRQTFLYFKKELIKNEIIKSEQKSIIFYFIRFLFANIIYILKNIFSYKKKI